MKMLKNFLLASVALLFFFGCSRYGNELQYAQFGTVKLQLTDAPFPYELITEANITITKVEVRLKEEGTETEEGGTSFETLFEGSETVNMMELTNGVMLNMGETEVPVGTYDLVRVYVTDASIKLTDETVYEVKVPSGSQTGIKVFIKPELVVVSELSEDLMLDVDLSQSFVLQGNLETPAGVTGFNFKPVLRAKNMSSTGSLSGTVTELVETVPTAVEGAEVSILVDGEVYTTTSTDASGGYTVPGLDPGTYTVTVNKTGYAEAEAEVSIAVANLTTQDFEISLQP
ncbi:DUF4382 domain-containing protein [Robiginitalea sp. IMCC44478]|uniref:DUF4382 domain-containing protein n=1 Tax=Robiginitalea sp. IMCC44478 TaxID=3459122 RepID=UPI0040419F32